MSRVGGYRAIVQKIDSGYVCPHCGLVLRDAVQLFADGSRLCRSCYEDICEKPSRRCTCCPGIAEGSTFFKDIAVNHEIQGILAMCENTPHGCSWEGRLRNYNDHFRECQYTPVQCPNDGCEVVRQGNRIEQHVTACPHRDDWCDYSGKRMPLRELGQHLEHCEDFYILRQEKERQSRLILAASEQQQFFSFPEQESTKGGVLCRLCVPAAMPCHFPELMYPCAKTEKHTGL